MKSSDKKRPKRHARRRARQSANGSAEALVFGRKKSMAARYAASQAREAYKKLQQINRDAADALDSQWKEQTQALEESRRTLRETQTRYADLYELAPIGYVTLDSFGRIEEINMMAATTLGRPARNLLKTPFTLYVLRDDLSQFMTHMIRCQRREHRVETELRLKSPEGKPIPVLLSTTPVSTVLKDGVFLYQTALVDFTDYKAVEEKIRQSEEHLRAIVDQATAGMARSDLKGAITFANQKFRELLGYEESELLGKTIDELTHPEDAGATRAAFKRLVKDGCAIEYEKRYIRKDGSVLWVDVSASPLRDFHGKPVSTVAVVVDITARKKAEAELKKSAERLEELVQRRTRALRQTNAELAAEARRRRGLEGQIIAVSDREQQRLGQELHDGLCQQLSAIGMMARATALRLTNHRVVDPDDLEKIAQLVSESAKNARDIARDLHKEEIEAAGFIGALQDLASRKIWKTPCRLSIKTAPKIEDDMVAAELYRILREAVVNANKHAQATEIVLEVRRGSNELVFSVTDNGIGLAPAKRRDNGGLGFHIMKYRATSIGGRLEVKSPAHGGTRVAVHLPQPK